MAQTIHTNVSSEVPCSGGNATVNHRTASAAATAVPSHSLTTVADGEDPFITGTLRVGFTKYMSDLILGPIAAAMAQAEVMDTVPDFPNQNLNASGVRACRPVDLVRPVHPMREYFVVTVGKCVGIFDSK